MSLGSVNNIYTGWDFVGEINPTSIFSFGWFDETVSSNISNEFDVYFAGWNNPLNSYTVLNGGWFSLSASENVLSDGVSRIYTAGWIPYDKTAIFSNGWLTSTVSENLDVDISRVYTAGWIPYDKNSVFTNGWFSTSAESVIENVLIGLDKLNLTLLLNEIDVKNSSNTLLDVLNLNFNIKPSEVYFEKNLNLDLNSLLLSLNLKEPLVNGIVVSLDKMILDLFLKEITVYGWGKFKTFLNQTDIRNINPTVEVKKSSILFEPAGDDLNNSNFGSW